MEDHRIIELYWQRSQEAIPATADKYGSYCQAIARNILRSFEDAEECVSDTWLAAWNAIPPQRPNVLKAFLGRITRNLSFNRWQRQNAEKRGGGEMELVLEELSDCVSGAESVQDTLERALLVQSINEFLAALPKEKRHIFLRRYWYADPVSAIAKECHMTPGNVSATLHRLRQKLRQHLTERGFAI